MLTKHSVLSTWQRFIQWRGLSTLQTMGAWSPEWKGQHLTLAGHCVLSELDTSLPLCFAQPSSILGGRRMWRGNKLWRVSIPYWSLCLSELDASIPLCFAQPSSIDGNGKLSGTQTQIREGGWEECGRGNKLWRASIPYWSLCFIWARHFTHAVPHSTQEYRW